MVKNLAYLKENKIIAVLRVADVKETMMHAEACVEAGVALLEIIMKGKDSLAVLGELSGMRDVLVGAGTVLDRETAKKAREYGAGFIVSPHTDADIIQYCNSSDIPVISGALTSSEIVNAWKLGADMVKIFPAAQTGGPEYIKAIRTPIDFIDIMATGGITATNMTDYFNAGVGVIGVSSALFGKDEPVTFKTVYKNVKNLVDIMEEYDGRKKTRTE